LVAPGEEAALDALEVGVALFVEELEGLEGADAGLAVEVVSAGGIEFVESLGQGGKGEGFGAGDAGQFAFVGAFTPAGLQRRVRFLYRLKAQIVPRVRAGLDSGTSKPMRKPAIRF